MQGLAVRYSGVRDAYGILWRSVLGRKTADTAGVFAEFENAREAYPQSNITRTVPPWPSEPAERFVWIIASDARPWVPTPAELDEALEHERERAAQQWARPLMKTP
jgi:hypothetical protein